MPFLRNTFAAIGAMGLYGFKCLNKDTSTSTTPATKPQVADVMTIQHIKSDSSNGYLALLLSFLLSLAKDALLEPIFWLELMTLFGPSIVAMLGSRFPSNVQIQALSRRLGQVPQAPAPTNTSVKDGKKPDNGAEIVPITAQNTTNEQPKEQDIATEKAQHMLRMIREKDKQILILKKSNSESLSNANDVARENARLVEDKRTFIFTLRKAIDPNGTYDSIDDITLVCKRVKQRLDKLKKEVDGKDRESKSVISAHNDVVGGKDGRIIELIQEKKGLKARVDELEVDLKKSSENAKRQVERLTTGKNEYKDAAKVYKQRAADSRSAKEEAISELEELRTEHAQELEKAEAETAEAQSKLKEARKVDSEQYKQMQDQVNMLHEERDQAIKEKEETSKAVENTIKDLEEKLIAQEKETQKVQKDAKLQAEARTKTNTELDQKLTKSKLNNRKLRAKNKREESQRTKLQELLTKQQSEFAKAEADFFQDQLKQRGERLTAEGKAARVQADFDEILEKYHASQLAKEQLEAQLKKLKRKQRGNKVPAETQSSQVSAQDGSKTPTPASTELITRIKELEATIHKLENEQSSQVQELKKAVRELQQKLASASEKANSPDEANQEQVKELKADIARLQQALKGTVSSSDAQAWCKTEVQRCLKIGQAELSKAAEIEIQKRVVAMKATMDEQFEQQLQTQVNAKVHQVLQSELQRGLDAQKATMDDAFERAVQDRVEHEKRNLENQFQGAVDTQLKAQKEKLETAKKNAAIRDADEMKHLRKSLLKQEGENKEAKRTSTSLYKQLTAAKAEAMKAKSDADKQSKLAKDSSNALIQVQNSTGQSDIGRVELELERANILLRELADQTCCRVSKYPHFWVGELHEANKALKQMEGAVHNNHELTLTILEKFVNLARLDEADFDEQVDGTRPELRKQLEQISNICNRMDTVLEKEFNMETRSQKLLAILNGPRYAEDEWIEHENAERDEANRQELFNQQNAATPSSDLTAFTPDSPERANESDTELEDARAKVDFMLSLATNHNRPMRQARGLAGRRKAAQQTIPFALGSSVPAASVAGPSSTQAFGEHRKNTQSTGNR